MTEANNHNLKRTQFWNRVQLLLILLVFAAPIIGAFVYQPSKFNNYGDLYVPARQVDNLTMQGADGIVELDSLRRQWVFLVVADGDCDRACESNILKMRQLRFMQNNDMTRIRTVFLYTDLAPARAADLSAKYRPFEAYSMAPEEFRDWTQQLLIDDAPEAAQRNRFYIIDPAGNLMISYPADAEPALMQKDIKRLLKTSQIG